MGNFTNRNSFQVSQFFGLFFQVWPTIFWTFCFVIVNPSWPWHSRPWHWPEDLCTDGGHPELFRTSAPFFWCSVYPNMANYKEANCLTCANFRVCFPPKNWCSDFSVQRGVRFSQDWGTFARPRRRPWECPLQRKPWAVSQVHPASLRGNNMKGCPKNFCISSSSPIWKSMTHGDSAW